ncbi:MAG: hypothetical protein ACK4TS_07125, partial [Aquabacterium sp.]
MSNTQAPKDPVRTYFCPINRIGAKDIQQMYMLYSSFYDQTSLDAVVLQAHRRHRRQRTAAHGARPADLR